MDLLSNSISIPNLIRLLTICQIRTLFSKQNFIVWQMFSRDIVTRAMKRSIDLLFLPLMVFCQLTKVMPVGIPLLILKLRLISSDAVEIVTQLYDRQLFLLTLIP